MNKYQSLAKNTVCLGWGIGSMVLSGELYAQDSFFSCKPNVIYILCDDLGYGEVGYNGQEKIETPELDRLASQRMIFSNHYCGNAVSAPSRCALLTGKHPGHALIRANSPGYPDGQVPLTEESETVGKLMQRAGYKTACIGKWGLGAFSNSGNPNRQGFDYFFGYTDQVHAHNYYPSYLWRNGEKVQLNEQGICKDYSHDLFTEETFRFIRENRSQPFFLYLAYTIPHVKYQVPDLAQYKNRDWPENMKIHAAMTSRLDKDVGRLVSLLEELKLVENTLIIFSSDNGAHGQFGSFEFFKTSGELRDKKRSLYEGGLRSPTFAYWPGTVLPGTVTDHISAFWDVLPTLSELTGESVRGETDGISFLPTLLGQPDRQRRHDYLYWELYEGRPQCAVRYKQWKGVVRDMREGLNVELYDVEKDGRETRDMAADYPAVVDSIKGMMMRSHQPNPYWDKDNKPLFDLRRACRDHGVEVRRKDAGNN